MKNPTHQKTQNITIITITTNVAANPPFCCAPAAALKTRL
jgi:hypothetical protein